MYEAIVFDLDGTLLDTLDDLWAAVNAAMRKTGLPLRTREEVRAFIGNGIYKLMQRACGKEGSEKLEEAFAAFKEYYAAHCEDKTQPYAGIIELLRALKARGIKTAVVSNKADFAVKKLADTYFAGLLLEAIGEDEAHGIRKKPAPDSLLAVLNRLGVEKDKALYVGDSEVDIQTAENAGIDHVSVTWGFKDREFLIEKGARVLIDDPAAIWEV